MLPCNCFETVIFLFSNFCYYVGSSSSSYVVVVGGGCVGVACAANEVCEKLAVIGFQTNLLSYLTRELHLPLTKAANTLTNFTGTASLTPLLGAFIADAYAGRFWTLTVASLIYQMVEITPPNPLIFNFLVLFTGIIYHYFLQRDGKDFFLFLFLNYHLYFRRL